MPFTARLRIIGVSVFFAALLGANQTQAVTVYDEAIDGDAGIVALGTLTNPVNTILGSVDGGVLGLPGPDSVDIYTFSTELPFTVNFMLEPDPPNLTLALLRTPGGVFFPTISSVNALGGLQAAGGTYALAVASFFGSSSYSFDIVPIPLPASLLSLVAALGGLIALGSRRRTLARA